MTDDETQDEARLVHKEIFGLLCPMADALGPRTVVAGTMAALINVMIDSRPEGMTADELKVIWNEMGPELIDQMFEAQRMGMQ